MPLHLVTLCFQIGYNSGYDLIAAKRCPYDIAGSGLGSGTTFPPRPDGSSAGGVGVGIPFTGVAAAEATLQAISSAPPFPGMDMGRELGRLARRSADLRE